jgi:hypothetical protein
MNREPIPGPNGKGRTADGAPLFLFRVYRDMTCGATHTLLTPLLNLPHELSGSDL